jgi:hypothetical protein
MAGDVKVNREHSANCLDFYHKHVKTVRRMLTIEEVITAPRSPFQNPYAERVIGSM